MPPDGCWGWLRPPPWSATTCRLRAWASGIAGYTIVFAAGQIVGPTFTGWIADGPGGLLRGLAVSALLLAVGALLAALQRPLDPLSHRSIV